MSESYAYPKTTANDLLLIPGLYSTWKPDAIGKLREAECWLITSGKEEKPDLPQRPASDATVTVQRDYKADKKDYKNWCRRDDRAIGIITSLLDPTIKQTIGEPTSSKALWDLLALNHKDEHAGLAAFFILRHIFDSRYKPLENGDSKAQQAVMLSHISDLTTENKKLGDDAFADSMMARIILMSLPRHTTWETLTVSLLQSEKLTVKDVTTRLLGEAGRIGSESSSTSPDQALAANHSHEPRSRSRLHNSHMSRVNSKSTSQPSLSQSSSTSKSHCDYC